MNKLCGFVLKMADSEADVCQLLRGETASQGMEGGKHA